MSPREMVEEIDESGVDLTHWEIDFVGSMLDWFEDHSSPTPRQLEIIERIHGERC